MTNNQRLSIFDAIEEDCKQKCSCYGCSYYELAVINAFPYEHCYKHHWHNEKPCDFERCDCYTTSRWIKLKTEIKSIINIFRRFE